MTTQPEPTAEEIAQHVTEQILSNQGPPRGAMVVPHATAMAFESGVDGNGRPFVRFRVEHAAGTTEITVPASNVDNICEGLQKTKANAEELARKALTVPQRPPLIIPGMSNPPNGGR